MKEFKPEQPKVEPVKAPEPKPTPVSNPKPNPNPSLDKQKEVRQKLKNDYGFSPNVNKAKRDYLKSRFQAPKWIEKEQGGYNLDISDYSPEDIKNELDFLSNPSGKKLDKNNQRMLDAVKMYYTSNATLDDIAKKIGVSGGRAKQIINKGIKMIQNRFHNLNNQDVGTQNHDFDETWRRQQRHNKYEYVNKYPFDNVGSEYNDNPTYGWKKGK